MRVPAPQARALARGAKRELRVPVDTRLTARPLRPATRHSGTPFNPTPDDILTIHGGHNNSGWVTTETVHCKITTANRGPLGVLTDEQARAEGHDTVAEFEIDFVERHDQAWLDKQIADLIAHDIPEKEALESRPEWARLRYQNRWTAREVWTLTVEPFHDMPLLLPGLPDEPEAIPPERIKKRWAERAAKRHAEAITDARAAERGDLALLDMERRLVALQAKAKMRHVDISSEMYLLKTRLRRGAGEEAVGRRLEAVERKALGEAA